jgi:hypothetical protein
MRSPAFILALACSAAPLDSRIGPGVADGLAFALFGGLQRGRCGHSR